MPVETVMEVMMVMFQVMDSDSGSSAANPNAYEIDEHDNVASKSSDYLQLGIICIVALLLLLVGYKRQKDKEEEE